MLDGIANKITSILVYVIVVLRRGWIVITRGTHLWLRINVDTLRLFSRAGLNYSKIISGIKGNLNWGEQYTSPFSWAKWIVLHSQIPYRRRSQTNAYDIILRTWLEIMFLWLKPFKGAKYFDSSIEFNIYCL